MSPSCTLRKSLNGNEIFCTFCQCLMLLLLWNFLHETMGTNMNENFIFKWKITEREESIKLIWSRTKWKIVKKIARVLERRWRWKRKEEEKQKVETKSLISSSRSVVQVRDRSVKIDRRERMHHTIARISFVCFRSRAKIKIPRVFIFTDTNVFIDSRPPCNRAAHPPRFYAIAQEPFSASWLMYNEYTLIYLWDSDIHCLMCLAKVSNIYIFVMLHLWIR